MSQPKTPSMMLEHRVNPSDVAMANFHWKWAIEQDRFKTLPPKVQELYHKFPPWKFYMTKDGRVCRVYGAMVTPDGRALLEVAMPHNGPGAGSVSGGMDPDQIVEVPNYPPDKLLGISLCGHADRFLLPNGYMEYWS